MKDARWIEKQEEQAHTDNERVKAYHATQRFLARHGVRVKRGRPKGSRNKVHPGAPVRDLTPALVTIQAPRLVKAPQ